jgi:hypothetical protein
MVGAIRWFVVPVVLAGLLAACGQDPDDDGVASLGDGATGSAASASPSVDPEEALQAFAECMREHGLEDFPDPTIDENGGIEISAGDPGDFGRAERDAAMQACDHLLPEGAGPGDGEGPSAEEQAAMEDALLAYAQCMRDHGIDMPDPEFSGGGVIQQGGDFDPNDPEFEEADDACRHFLGDAGINIGEAPNE